MGSFRTNLLPGGGVLRVRWARSPAPPRLPNFTTPRYVCYLATRLHSPADYVAPLMQRPPGRRHCQARDAGLSPVKPPWAGAEACLTAGLVRDALRLYCLGGCTALLVFVQRSWQIRRAGLVPLLVAPPLLAVRSLRSSRMLLRIALSCCPLPLPAGTPFHVVCAFCELSRVALLVCVACTLPGYLFALLRCSRLVTSPCTFARALREVPLHGAGRAVARGSCPLRVSCLYLWLFPSWVQGGGLSALHPSRLLVALRGLQSWAHTLTWLPVPWAGIQGPLPTFSGRGTSGMGARHQPLIASWCCALWGWQEGILGGGASCPCGGRPVLGAQPPPAARPWGRQSWSTAHMLSVRLCRRGDPALAPWLACPAEHCGLGGWQEDAREGAPLAVVRGFWG